jgi:hypothetical protein
MMQIRRFIVGALCAMMAGVGNAYVIGGPSALYQPDNFGWTWDGGAFTTPFRSALENPSNFGPGGVVPYSVQTVNVDMAGPTPFAGLDGFIVPWWSVGQSSPYHAAVIAFFLGGGDLWLMQDSSGRDGVGAALGIPTVGQTAITPVNGIAPMFVGPFGTALNVGQGGGEEGFISEADVLALNGTVVGRNTESQVIAAFWGADQFAVGAGALVVVADIDMFTTQATFDPVLDDNGIFALNTFAFLSGSTGPIPEPGTLALLGIGLFGCVVLSRRRNSAA